ncbi:hypothetical protein [Meiothermus hypogaeus]|jgi:hypothetical protein|uniref:Uncharacterized protein n=1 Tax=Meiothermus hypogaeus NBRC 106114 TaxID=1227553 RepID=A0A511QXW2_9DEIN|nr:hypothetical protein [Meiothermus hypogaeus]GEM82214.1 hypothetical protein MHY01S_03800 [Meiothermus hypogaeus NBRC 106114]
MDEVVLTLALLGSIFLLGALLVALVEGLLAPLVKRWQGKGGKV